MDTVVLVATGFGLCRLSRVMGAEAISWFSDIVTFPPCNNSCCSGAEVAFSHWKYNIAIDNATCAERFDRDLEI